MPRLLNIFLFYRELELHDKTKTRKSGESTLRGIDMIAITLKAKEKIEESLQEQTTDTEKAFRIITTGSIENPIGFILDKEVAEDLVVESEEGRSLLLIGPVLGDVLEGTVIDYGETQTESMFIIYKQGYIN